MRRATKTSSGTSRFRMAPPKRTEKSGCWISSASVCGGTLTSGFARSVDPATAHDRALRVLDGSVNLQAAVLSFNDTFFFLLGKPPTGVKVSAGH